MSSASMTSAIYWFRNDLRLHDNPALAQACAQQATLLPVYCLGSASAIHNGDLRWGTMQASIHRQHVLLDTLADLDAQLRALGTRTVHCETIAATHEQDELDNVNQTGMDVHSTWQSSLFAPDALPFKVQNLPPVYTQFRQALAKASTQRATPLPAPTHLPPLPAQAHGYATVNLARQRQDLGQTTPEPRASVPYWQAAFAGGERAALAHLAGYFASDLSKHYRATRNQLTGTGFSSKFSIWLASGAL